MIKTHLEIDLDQAEKNAKILKEKYSEYKYLIGVLKSNAYGHGEYIVNAFIKGVLWVWTSLLISRQVVLTAFCFIGNCVSYNVTLLKK